MAISQLRPNRKVSGGKYKAYRKKKQYELGSKPILTKIGKNKAKKLRILGANNKEKLLSADTVNLADPKTKKFQKAKILNVIECPANRHFARRNILVKGAIIETDKGKARITSRPGQEGSINAVLA